MKLTVVIAFLAVLAAPALADERAQYNARAAADAEGAFRALDRNGDGVLTHDEVRGDLNLGPRFDAIDTNRDGIVTAEELAAYVERTYGVADSMNYLSSKQ